MFGECETSRESYAPSWDYQAQNTSTGHNKFAKLFVYRPYKRIYESDLKQC